jgi:hypothetical protein
LGFGEDDGFVRKLLRAFQEENHPMHDLIIALAFIGMLISPAIVAAFSGADTDAQD